MHRQPVTGRRYTGLTVTFSRPFESRIWPPNGSQEGLALSILRTTVAPPRLGTADQPHRAGVLGRALHAPGLARCALGGCPGQTAGTVVALRALHAGGPVDGRSTSPPPPGPMAAAKASIPTASGTDSSLWDHMRQSPMTERPLWKVLLAPVFERHKRGQQLSAQRAGVGRRACSWRRHPPDRWP